MFDKIQRLAADDEVPLAVLFLCVVALCLVAQVLSIMVRSTAPRSHRTVRTLTLPPG